MSVLRLEGVAGKKKYIKVLPMIQWEEQGRYPEGEWYKTVRRLDKTRRIQIYIISTLRTTNVVHTRWGNDMCAYMFEICGEPHLFAIFPDGDERYAYLNSEMEQIYNACPFDIPLYPIIKFHAKDRIVICFEMS